MDIFKYGMNTTKQNWKGEKSMEFGRTRRIDGLCNFLNPDGTLLSKEWFADVWYFKEGFAPVQREDGMENLLKSDGTLLSKEWFADVWY